MSIIENAVLSLIKRSLNRFLDFDAIKEISPEGLKEYRDIPLHQPYGKRTADGHIRACDRARNRTAGHNKYPRGCADRGEQKLFGGLLPAACEKGGILFSLSNTG